MIEFRILGPLLVLDDGHSVEIRGAKERAVLAILLLSPGQVVSVDQLIDALWDAEPPATARNSLHVRIAGLRKALGADRIDSRAAGYVLRVEPGELDLERFEHLLLRGGSDDLAEALAQWSGPALADFAGERWAASAINRLEEMRLSALERRIEFDLELGRHAQLVGELETLVADHPLRERLRAQLMLALYRSGRQADALEVYKVGRASLVAELGIEPYPAMRDLQQAILRQDPALDLNEPRAPERSILVAALDPDRLAALLELAESLARRPRRELIVMHPITGGGEPAAVTAALQAHRDRLVGRDVPARVAAFRSTAPGVDVARFAREQDVDLVVIDAPAALLDDPAVADLLGNAPCDVALIVDGEPGDGPVLVPFVGVEHDWSAVEIGAWLARARGVPLRLTGPVDDQHDSSRLLASASLAVQRALGVDTEPVLIEPGINGLVRVANDAGVVVVGLSDRWQKEGLGSVRSALTQGLAPPVMLVHHGLRPGGIAPPEGHSRFTWSIRGRG